MTSPQVVCFGELLIDMIATSTGNLIEVKGFLKKFGGAPANTACGLAKLGLPVSFMGKVGDDPFGHFLKKTLNENNVNTNTLLLDPANKTTLAFVSLTKTGERDFVFYKGAHELITPSEVTLPPHTSIFHFGSLTQINPSAKQTTASLIQQAKKIKSYISYDPNIRESLWGDLKKARSIILDTAKNVDALKLNEEEAFMLAGTKNIKLASKKLFTTNLDALFITLGSKGCYYKTKNYEGLVSVDIKIKPIDTTGAGDAFNAGYITVLFETNKRFSDMNKQVLEKYLKKANTIAALTTTKRGAISAFPTKKVLSQYTKL